MAKGFDNTKPNTGSNNPRIEDLVDLFKIPNEWAQVRFLPEITSYYVFWITTKNKEGKKAKAFPKLCLDYNPETEEFDKEICPYRKAQAGRGQKVYLANAIIRELQKNEPRRVPKHTKKERKYQRDHNKQKVYRKDKDSSSWTPVRVIRLPSSLVRNLQNLRGLNKHKGNSYDITDIKNGADVHLSHDPKIEGAQQYKVQLAERSSLSKEEFEYLRYSIFGIMQPESLDEAKEEMRRIKSRLWKGKDESGSASDDYYSSDDNKSKRKKRKGKKSKRKQESSSDVPAYDDSSDIDMTDSSDEKKKKRKKSKSESWDKSKEERKHSKSKDKKSKDKKSKSKRRKNDSDSSEPPF